jgi:hypothetical protein
MKKKCAICKDEKFIHSFSAGEWRAKSPRCSKCVKEMNERWRHNYGQRRTNSDLFAAR